jgi:MoaA/NifB/PqqE/SkfB family radical SAM enzyme
MNVTSRLLQLVRRPRADAAPRLRRINLLVQACNLSCPMCSMNVNNKDIGQILLDYPGASKGHQLRLEEYKAFFDTLRPYRPDVSISGGEPMLFNRMTELVEYLAGECGYPVGMTTNGTLLDGDKLERVGRALSAVTISIDGLQERHDRIRGQGNFAISTAALRALLELKRAGRAKTSISSLFCLHEENYQDTEAVADFLLRDVGVENLTVSHLIFSTPQTLAAHEQWVKRKGLPEYMNIRLTRGGYSSRADLSRMDLAAVFETKERLKARYRNIRFEPDFRTLDDLRTYFLTDEVMNAYFASSCKPSRTQLTLLSNGDVLFFPQCFQVKLGNIRTESAQAIWNSEVQSAIRRALSDDLSPICAHCCANRVSKDVYPL